MEHFTNQSLTSAQYASARANTENINHAHNRLDDTLNQTSGQQQLLQPRFEQPSVRMTRSPAGMKKRTIYGSQSPRTSQKPPSVTGQYQHRARALKPVPDCSVLNVDSTYLGGGSSRPNVYVECVDSVERT